MNGGIASSSSRRPHSTPMPDGASILWPVATKKSTPSACTSTAWCGADCAPSSSTSAPTSRARATSVVDRVGGAEDVADVHERQHLRALVDQGVEVGQVEAAVVGQREPAQRRAGALAEHLPRHEVGVVLHLGDDDLVARAEREPRARDGVAEGVGDEVVGLGGVLGEHDLVARRARPGSGRPSRAPPRSRRSPPARACAPRGGRCCSAAPRTSARRRAPGAACASVLALSR